VRHTGVAIFVLALIMAGCLFAWSAPERVDRKPDGYIARLLDIAASDDGTPHVVWSECPSGTYHEKVMYARKLQDTWSIPENISRDSGDIRVPAIIIDSRGAPFVVWWEEGSGWFKYVRLIGDTWSVPKLTFVQAAAIPRLAMDSHGRIHVLFDGSGGIWHSSYVSEADSWTTPDRVAAGELSWQDIAVDRLGHLHAVWMDYSTNGIGYSFYDGTRWAAREQLPDPSSTGQSCDPRIAADANCIPHVVWQEREGGYILYYIQRAGDTWTTPYKLLGQSGGYQNIAVDETDRLHVVWGWSYGVRYVTRTSAGWSCPASVVDSVVAPVPELALSASRLHVAWRQNWGIYYGEEYLPGFRPAVTSGCFSGPLRAFRTTSGYRLDFGIASADFASLVLANSAGRVVRNVQLGYFGRGRYGYELTLDSVPSGIYFCTIRAGSESSTAKLVVCR